MSVCVCAVNSLTIVREVAGVGDVCQGLMMLVVKYGRCCRCMRRVWQEEAAPFFRMSP